MAYTFTRTGAQIEEIHNTVSDPSTNQDFTDSIGEQVIPKYTDIVYKASGGNSAVENMIAGVPVVARVGDMCRAVGLEYERVGASSPGGIGDFELKASSKVVNELPQYPHVMKYTDDNKRLRGVLEGKICSMEGETFNITEQIVINGDKTIRTNSDTQININSQIDSPIIFNGHVQQDGSGKIKVDCKMNDKSDSNCAAITFPNNIPMLEKWDISNTNGCSILVGRDDLSSDRKGQGSGQISLVKGFNVGRGVHVYGSSALDASIDLIDCATDNQSGTNGNIAYLSECDKMRIVRGAWRRKDGLPADKGSPNINKGRYGYYVGGTYEGLSRGPTFGEGLEYGSITGGGISRDCTFAAISTDLKRGDGTYPVGKITVDDWQAIGCLRTMYIQAQGVLFGNITTRDSTATDFLFRINGASSDSVEQTGSIIVRDCVNEPQIINLGEQSNVKLNFELISHDLPVSKTILASASGDNLISGMNPVIEFRTADSDIVMPNIANCLLIKLRTDQDVTTLRLPDSSFSNIKDQITKIVIYGGNGVRRLRISRTSSSGTINGGTGYIDVIPQADDVLEKSIMYTGDANYFVY